MARIKNVPESFSGTFLQFSLRCRQTPLRRGETLDKVYVDRPDYKGWAMVIRNIHQDRTNVGYIVGTVSDHVLNVNGEDVSLRDLCGKNAPVRFNYEFWLV